MVLIMMVVMPADGMAEIVVLRRIPSLFPIRIEGIVCPGPVTEEPGDNRDDNYATGRQKIDRDCFGHDFHSD